jgi:hypothetical protein
MPELVSLVLPASLAMKPLRLCLYATSLFVNLKSTPSIHPSFTFITHLDLFDVVYDAAGFPSLFLNLAVLAALTHLGLLLASKTVAELLLTSRKLDVLIRMQSNPLSTEDLLSLDDARFVCMALSDDEYEDDWITGITGGLDFWARSDLFVAKKRRGEITPSSSFLESPVRALTHGFRLPLLDRG